LLICFARGLQRSSYTSSGISRGKDRHPRLRHVLLPSLSSYLPLSSCTWIETADCTKLYIHLIKGPFAKVLKTTVVVSTWAGISPAPRCTGLFLQAKSGNDSNDSLSRSRTSPRSNMNIEGASSVRELIQRKAFFLVQP